MTPGANCNICGRWRPTSKLDLRWVRDRWTGDVAGEWICDDQTRCARRWSRWDRFGGTRLGDAVRFRFARDPREAS